MSHYNELGIERTATGEEIKRAYFRLVRKFSPEKNPEAFMALRRAYEALSDPEKRSNYDARLSRFGDLSDKAISDVMEAEALSDRDLTGDAIALLERKVPEYASAGDPKASAALESALCRFYIGEEKTGKAVKLAEKLVKEDPTDVSRLRLALRACAARGYMTKARAYLETLERLEPGNEDNYLTIFKNDWKDLGPSFWGETAENVRRQGGKAPVLCAYALSSCFGGNNIFSFVRNAAYYDILKGMDEEDLPFEDPLYAAKMLADHTEEIDPNKGAYVGIRLQMDILKGMVENDRYDLLPYIDRVIENIGQKEICKGKGYICASAGYAALEAVRTGTPKMLAALPVAHAWAQSNLFDEEMSATCRDEILALELDILAYYQWVKPHLKRFRDEFGALYRYAADFLDKIGRLSEDAIFDEASRRIPRAERIEKRLALSWLGPEDDFGNGTEPIRVEKIGRNDPCPCGSGKKYKKCCGRGVG